MVALTDLMTGQTLNFLRKRHLTLLGFTPLGKTGKMPTQSSAPLTTGLTPIALECMATI
jgi:hypothetical protein